MLLTVSAAVLIACGEEEPQPLVIEPASVKPAGKPIDLDLPRDPSGAFAFDRWPKACDLLTDADIKAVLPQLTKVKREPEDQEITLTPALTADAVPAPARTVTAKGANCTYKLQLPAAGLKDRYDIEGSSGASLLVSVTYAGAPKAVKQNFGPGVDPVRVEVPAGQCYGRDNASSVSCRKASLAFSVSSSVSPQEVEDGEYKHRYRVKGKITTFPTGEGTLRSDEFRRKLLDAELAKIVLAKI